MTRLVELVGGLALVLATLSDAGPPRDRAPAAQAREAEAPLQRFRFDAAYDRVQATGLPVRDADEAWARLVEYRSTYGTSLQALIEYLLAPAGFWGHSPENADDGR